MRVEAAGGVVASREPDEPVRVALVHRPRHDDWSLPKGKLESGETAAEAALREVREETGLACELEAELGAVSYVDAKGRDKRVRYWLMRPPAVPEPFQPNREVDELRWCEVPAALELLDYEGDRHTVREAARRLGG